MQDIAGWIALIATCVAALMTASNLGARVTGWGFVLFTVGAIAWIVVAMATGQVQLLWSNIVLGLVDLFGIWRWLGHRARIADTARVAEERSRETAGEPMFSIAALDGMPVAAADGSVIAHAVDALAASAGGRIDYVIVREGGVAGVGETLRCLPWRDARVSDRVIQTTLDAASLAALPVAQAA